MVGGLKGYERKLKLSKDFTNPKWQPLHPPASFNIQARRKKKILEKNNWFKKSSSLEEEKNNAEQIPYSQEEDSQHAGGETSLPSSQQEHQTVGKSLVNLGQGKESTINFPTKSNILKIHKDNKNNFKPNKNTNQNQN